jgi:DNA-binding winged helix-turn-helix (wHTH) protein
VNGENLQQTSEIFQFGEFRLDPLDRTLRRQETAVPLHRRAFDVLLYLVQNPGRVVSKDELLKNVWPDTFVDENNLTQSISVLRKALDQRAGEASYITTLPGRGYQFVVPVQVDVPRVRAVLALQHGKPWDAIAALEIARPYEMRDYNILSLRAEAYRKAGQPAIAVSEYQKIIANRGIDPTSILYPLAYLGLARSYAMLGNTESSRTQYQAFLGVWKNADRDLPLYQQANSELVKL